MTPNPELIRRVDTPVLTNGNGAARGVVTPTFNLSDLTSVTKFATRSGTGGGPELKELKFGFLPLTDCAPLVVAHEKGFFAQFGIEASLAKLGSWTAARDALNTGACHAAQLLFGIPIAAALGKLGTNTKPLVIPWILSRNGQAITLHSRYQGRVAADAKALRKEVQERRDKGRPFVFAMTLAPGTHAMWLRYWLGAGGINPDNDLALITVPPPQMVANMKMGNLDGFSVGEPWNARALAEGVGYTAVTSQQIWPDHPEKVLGFTEEFAGKHPGSVKAALKALHLAGEWLGQTANQEELSQILSRPEYLNCAAELILPRLRGSYELGGGRQIENDPYAVQFGANYPQPKFALWWLSQMRRWNMTLGMPNYAGITNRVIRADLHDAALAELGIMSSEPDFEPVALCDGVSFDAKDPEACARSFAVSPAKFE